MLSKDLQKQQLYEGVKTIIESNNNHIHLSQHKLYTLYSIGFQYLLFLSTKKSGAYIVRLEDNSLAKKLSHKAKDASSRKFLQSLILPRKLKYGKSIFYLDFFHIGSWALTSEIPPEKIQAALIVKNTSDRPMTEMMVDDGDEVDETIKDLPPNYYHSSLREVCPKTVTIALDCQFEGTHDIQFPFIKKEREKISGLTLSSDLDFDNLD